MLISILIAGVEVHVILQESIWILAKDSPPLWKCFAKKKKIHEPGAVWAFFTPKWSSLSLYYNVQFKLEKHWDPGVCNQEWNSSRLSLILRLVCCRLHFPRIYSQIWRWESLQEWIKGSSLHFSHPGSQSDLNPNPDKSMRWHLQSLFLLSSVFPETFRARHGRLQVWAEGDVVQ